MNEDARFNQKNLSFERQSALEQVFTEAYKEWEKDGFSGGVFRTRFIDAAMCYAAFLRDAGDKVWEDVDTESPIEELKAEMEEAPIKKPVRIFGKNKKA